MPDLSLVPPPDLTDPLFAPFWAGLRAGHLLIRHCGQCQRPTWPPRDLCPACGSAEATWPEVEPAGILFSFTTVGFPTAKGFAATPYSVGLVELADRPTVRLLGLLAATGPAPRIGQALTATFPPAGPGGEFNVIQWQHRQRG